MMINRPLSLFEKYGPAVVDEIPEWKKRGYEVKDHMGHTLLITAFNTELRMESWPKTVCIKLTGPTSLKRERSIMRVEPHSSERIVEVVNEYLELARLENAKLTPERLRLFSAEWRDLIERMQRRGVTVLLGYYGPGILSFDYQSYSVQAVLKNASWQVTSSQGAGPCELDDRPAIRRIEGLMLIAPFFRTQLIMNPIRSALNSLSILTREGKGI